MDKILVIGASGFTGGPLARALASAGRPVRCLARAPAKFAALQAAGCEIVEGDFCDGASLAGAFAGVRAAYVSTHTIGRQPFADPKADFMAVETAGMLNILSAAEAAGTRRLIVVTSLGVDKDGPGDWLKGRWRWEERLLQSAVDVTIIRPGMIVGRGGRGFEMLASQARARLAIGLQGGDGMRCIALDDLIFYLLAVLDDPRAFGRRFDVGNDDILTNQEIIDVNAALLGRRPPLKISIPNALIAAAGPVIERLTGTPKGAIRGMIESFGGDGRGDPSAIRAIAPRTLLSYREAAAPLLMETTRA